ncbi:GNAT family N-acetyltransferase [Agrococcus sp. SGAir0287]|uniref:GNAT family N-acetyltransferase n=1 Tax=Agrococcus sp. SGAir0287 TaxID=2070347 RepID=UPI0020C7E517|nr:GNAT family N-acetyltransferase [Agrococcus sp. SGAir0287]
MTDASLASGYRMLLEPPTVDEYRRLRAVSGLSPKTAGQAEGAIAGTWTWRTVRLAGAGGAGPAVAMGRVVGDGGWYFLVADMATLPEHQGRGLGKAVLRSLLAEIRERAEPGAYVTLTADPPGRRLYEAHGFEDVAPARTGMSLLT